MSICQEKHPAAPASAGGSPDSVSYVALGCEGSWHGTGVSGEDSGLRGHIGVPITSKGPAVLESHLPCTALVPWGLLQLLALVCPSFDPSLKDILPNPSSEVCWCDFQKLPELVGWFLVHCTCQSLSYTWLYFILTKASFGSNRCCLWVLPWTTEMPNTFICFILNND